MADRIPTDTTTTTTTAVDCDFLIVGAGSSGCVLASRLVRQGLRVLLVEKGPADDGTLKQIVRRPSQCLAAALSGNAVSEVFVTEPQAGLGGRCLHAFRGQGGGGTSNINAALYCRGSKKDYEENWHWKLADIEASFKSIEAELILEEHPPTGTVAPSCNRMLEEIGVPHASPAEGETGGAQNGGNSSGGGGGGGGNKSDDPTWTREGLGGCPMKRTTTKGGQRQSAWDAFVKPVMAMPNLRIKDDAVVSRVIIEGGRAVAVEVLESAPSWRGSRTRVRELRLAKETAEVILCCGAFRTPKLLMLSGIGPRQHLEEKGVPVVLDMPHVGQNLHDHLVIPTLNSSKLTMEESDYSEDSLHGQVYFSCGIPAPPPLSSAPGKFRSTTTDGDGGGGGSAGTDPTSSFSPSALVGLLYFDGGNSLRDLPCVVSMQLLRWGLFATVVRVVLAALCWMVTWLPPISRMVRGTRGAILVVTTVESRGTVRLASADVLAPPLIDPAYLSHPRDLQVACAGWRTLRRAKRETSTGKAVFGDDILPGKRYNYGSDDESFLAYVRDNCSSFYHPVGTCRMGKGVEDSVVSADNLRVHGVSGLRVADASVARRIPSAPIQAMAMMIGDRAASIALSDRAAK